MRSKTLLSAPLIALAALAGAFPLLPALAGTPPASPINSESVAQATAALQQANSEVQAIAQNWPQIQQAAQGYGKLSSYANQAGISPVVRNGMGYPEQCHNAYWDNEIPQLITGAMNIAGDAEAQAYALQAISIAWAQDADNLLEAEAVQSTDSANLSNAVQQEVAAANALNGLLSTVGNQIAAAIGPNSGLTQLPISTWQAGIGDYPNLSAVQWVPGPADGAPIGWYMDQIPVNSVLARLVDVCPTGTAIIPEESDATTLSAVQMAEEQEPELTQVIPSVTNGSAWTAPAILNPYSAADYQTRVQLVQALGEDLPRIAAYMAPITQAIQSFAAQANQVTQSLSSGQ